MKFKRCMSLFLCLAMLCGVLNVSAFAAETRNQSTVYVDGKAFSYTIRDDGTVEIRCLEDGGKAFLTISQDGTANAVAMDEKGNYVPYELKINALSSQAVDVRSTHMPSARIGDSHVQPVVEEFKCLEDVVGSKYSGQATLVIAAGISLSSLLTVFLAVIATIVVGGCVYYAVSTVIDKIKSDYQKQKYYYKAYISDYVTYIAFYSGTITQSQAASRIKSGQSVYTYTKALAKTATVAAGMGYVGPEIHYRSGKFSFYHFHTANRNGAHCLYGLPYVP